MVDQEVNPLARPAPAERIVDLAARLWPGLRDLPPEERRAVLADIYSVPFGLLITLASLLWLSLVSRPAALLASWPLLLITLIFTMIVGAFEFYWVVHRPSGRTSLYGANLSVLVLAAALWLVGPETVWISMLLVPVELISEWPRRPLAQQRWALLRNALMGSGSIGLGMLSCVALYGALGGPTPLPGLSPAAVGAALAGVAALLAVVLAAFGALVLAMGWLGLSSGDAAVLRDLVRFAAMTIAPPLVFSILAAALYSGLGLAGYLFFLAGVLLVSVIAHRLSRAVAASDQRRLELGQLEALGRAIIAAPPGAAALPELLRAHAPAMFRERRLLIRLADGQELLRLPAGAPSDERAAAWLLANPAPGAWPARTRPPWAERPAPYPLAAAPINSPAGGAPLGFALLELEGEGDSPAEALPALQALAATVASALHRADEHRRELALERFTQELSTAGQIQASFLPTSTPRLPGWQLAVTLRPARETSGDFYDLLLLPDGRLGIVVADVADKGTGAALFMALSRTLIRTYAFEHPAEPAAVLAAANRRILSDTNSSMFVTIFYGVLDPQSGALAYANAGHNPPFVLRRDGRAEPLRNTGVPLGIDPDLGWQQREVRVEPGELLLLYTDGVSEAQNQRGELFEEQRLLRAVQGAPPDADAVQAAVLAAVDQFVGPSPQFDDITLMVLAREQG